MLIDISITHSFLDAMITRKIGCVLKFTNLFRVTVADGGTLECNTRSPKIDLEMGNCRFSAAMRILKLGGSDMVIGMDLLRQLGSVTFTRAHQIFMQFFC